MRWVRCLLARLWPAAEWTFTYDQRYRSFLPGAPIDGLRAEKILTALALERLLRSRTVHQPVEVSIRELATVHDESYLERLSVPGSLLEAVGVDVPVEQQDRALEVQRLMVGGTIAAAHRARRDGGVVCHLGGGLHHAHANRGKGFCLFNDVAVAVRSLREAGFLSPILVVDLDLHDGDGTRALFADDPSVHTFSIHNRHWSDPEAVASTSIELGDGVEDQELLAVLRRELPPVIDEHRPKLVFYLAGTDPAKDDAIGNWRISADGLLARDRFVLSQLHDGTARRVPMVVLLAGGYGPHSWRYTARTLLDRLSRGAITEPATEEDVLVARYRYVSRLLTPAQLTGDTFELTEEDVVGALFTGITETRFLGYYSRQGLELALEQAGVLDQLRSMGFVHPTVELDLSHPSGHTLRVFADIDRRDLLIEVRLRRDRLSLPGFELLAVEWMLLQNPRASFTSERPRLPGQSYPGLGLLKEAVAMLVAACHRLSLDGLGFVPSHFHLATQSRKYLRFVRPGDEALFEALQRCLGHLPLDRASAAVESGRLRDGSGAVFRWPVMPMVLPVSRRLEERFASEAYRAEVAAAEPRHGGILLPESAGVKA